MKRAVGQRDGSVIFDCVATLSEITGIDELSLDRRVDVDLLVAFAGVAARPNVMAAADVVIRQNSMAPVLALALDRAPHHEPGRSVYHRGAALLQGNHSE